MNSTLFVVVLVALFAALIETIRPLAPPSVLIRVLILIVIAILIVTFLAAPKAFA